MANTLHQVFAVISLSCITRLFRIHTIGVDGFSKVDR